jgi:hypothetical protein
VSRTTESIQNSLSDTVEEVRKDKPAPFWSTVQADIHRFSEEDNSARCLIRGLLSQGFQAVFVYRIFRWFYERRIPTQPLRFFVERFIEIITGISIPAQAKIGKGLQIHHFGGIIVHSDAVIGEYCTVYHGVTLGDRGGWGGAPRVGNRGGSQIDWGDCHWRRLHHRRQRGGPHFSPRRPYRRGRPSSRKETVTIKINLLLTAEARSTPRGEFLVRK